MHYGGSDDDNAEALSPKFKAKLAMASQYRGTRFRLASGARRRWSNWRSYSWMGGADHDAGRDTFYEQIGWLNPASNPKLDWLQSVIAKALLLWR
ncbi:MAG TPA: hypothetical protein VGG72_09755 [Bryobacteraceae bacterium]